MFCRIGLTMKHHLGPPRENRSCKAPFQAGAAGYTAGAGSLEIRVARIGCSRGFGGVSARLSAPAVDTPPAASVFQCPASFVFVLSCVLWPANSGAGQRAVSHPRRISLTEAVPGKKSGGGERARCWLGRTERRWMSGKEGTAQTFHHHLSVLQNNRPCRRNWDAGHRPMSRKVCAGRVRSSVRVSEAGIFLLSGASFWVSHV